MNAFQNNDKAILLDVDGVLSEWTISCCALFSKDTEEVMAQWSPGQYHIENALGVDSETLWKRIDAEGEDYWANLPHTKWAIEFYHKCQEIAPTYFLTAPSHAPGSMAGKLRWLKTFTGNDYCDNYLVGHAKFLCANACNILVDDGDHNVDAFRAAGGEAILFPRLWNSECHEWHRYGENAYLYVLSKLHKLVLR